MVQFLIMIGFTGSDCSYSKMIDLQKGEKVGNLLILVGSSLLIGMIIGGILIWYLGREASQEDINGIKNEEEEGDEDDEGE